jgi:hypothetical protein
VGVFSSAAGGAQPVLRGQPSAARRSGGPVILRFYRFRHGVKADSESRACRLKVSNAAAKEVLIGGIFFSRLL